MKVSEDLSALAKRLSNWGRWGKDDERGTTNLITPARLVAAARLVKTGRIFDLGIPFAADGPQPGGPRVNPVHLMSATGANHGFPASDVTPNGALHDAIDKQAKGIAGRGVLLDVAALKDVPWLAAGTLITPADLEAAMQRQGGVAVGPGDILLFRTGWRRLYLERKNAAEFMGPEPGLGVPCCQLLRQR